jgi:hypothetical protein
MKNLVNKSLKSIVLTIIFVSALFIFFGTSAYSQENYCLSKLKSAQELFDSGIIEEIPQMLDSCLKGGFNKEQTIQAYRLLIQVYLFDYNQEKAEKTMLALLTQFPEYDLQTNDPVEFVNLYKQFQTKPTFSMGVNAGVNMSDITVVERFSTGNLNKINSTYDFGDIQPQIQLVFEKYFGSRTWITFGAGYSFAGYTVEENMNFDRELLMFSEKMQFAYAPLYFNYSFRRFNKKFTPYLYVGGQYNYLIKSEGEISRRTSGNGTTYDLAGVSSDITNSRYKSMYSALAGIGFRLKIASGYLRANATYTRGLSKYIKEDSRFSDSEKLFYYNYIDDDINLNFFNFTLGYSYIFYKTHKKAIVDSY